MLTMMTSWRARPASLPLPLPPHRAGRGTPTQSLTNREQTRYWDRKRTNQETYICSFLLPKRYLGEKNETWERERLVTSTKRFHKSSQTVYSLSQSHILIAIIVLITIQPCYHQRCHLNIDEDLCVRPLLHATACSADSTVQHNCAVKIVQHIIRYCKPETR